MLTQQDINDLCIAYLIHNKQVMKALIGFYTKQYNELMVTEDSMLHSAIKREYTDHIRAIFLGHLCKQLDLLPDSVLSFLEDINLLEYVK